MSVQDLARIKLAAFQQPLNCCNVTAIAYALSALGIPTRVDDIFHDTRMPVTSVLDDGMTLAETYDAAVRYVSTLSLPVSVHLEHFDCPDGVGATLERFRQEVVRATTDSEDIHILNFCVSTAHANPNLRGGHFSLLAEHQAKTDHLTVADTNPRKYTRFWQCPVERMYLACVAADPASQRARGMLIIRRLSL